ncbi:MAG: PEP-CTERM sorting domain-containing protein [Phycisphaerae bacterium]|nr:PEP-CTERM sorting domain-containing protein [Phycisphaerae bacterium]
MKTILCVFSIFLFTASISAVIVSETFGFYAITSNGIGSSEIGESQLFMDVIGNSPQTVLFRFRNTGPQTCTIAEIYFDDDSLLTLNQIQDTPGQIDFVQFAKPADLPGRNTLTPSFATSNDLSFEAVSPAPKYGVNAGEQVELLFDLQSGYGNVINALRSGDLQVGMHVINFVDYNGASESFVNEVPEPVTALLLLCGAAAIRHRRKK